LKIVFAAPNVSQWQFKRLLAASQLLRNHGFGTCWLSFLAFPFVPGFTLGVAENRLGFKLPVPGLFAIDPYWH